MNFQTIDNMQNFILFKWIRISYRVSELFLHLKLFVWGKNIRLVISSPEVHRQEKILSITITSLKFCNRQKASGVIFSLSVLRTWSCNWFPIAVSIRFIYKMVTKVYKSKEKKLWAFSPGGSFSMERIKKYYSCTKRTITETNWSHQSKCHSAF